MQVSNGVYQQQTSSETYSFGNVLQNGATYNINFKILGTHYHTSFTAPLYSDGTAVAQGATVTADLSLTSS